MLRTILAILLVAAAAVVALWQFDVISLPFGQGSLSRQPAVPDLLEAATLGATEDMLAALEAGTPVDTRNSEGATPLLLAVNSPDASAAVSLLLEHGADLHAADAAGNTVLHVAARDTRDPATVLLLMNAGADPTVRNLAGETAADLAARNPTVSATRLVSRLRELQDSQFDRNWPSGYLVPVDGATISSRASHLPGALRAYRNGRHEGFDFYQGTVSVPISFGTPIQAVAAGTVIRADHHYTEMTLEEYEAVIAESQSSLTTPPEALDRLRGMQVWISHPGGFVSRYAHLSAIEPVVQVGSTVSQGQVIAATGNSGTLEAAQLTQDDPHPHVELWRGDTTYLGAGMETDEIYRLAEQVFGTAAMPPFIE